MPNFPLGHYAHTTRLANARHAAQLDKTAPPPPTHHYAGYEYPDPVDLRGIPALARGVGGTIAGTQPERRACR